MRLGPVARCAFVFVPLLLVCAGRLHASRAATPDRMTSEVNRCLTVMRAAASRRKKTTKERELEERLALSVKTDAGSPWKQSGRPAQSA